MADDIRKEKIKEEAAVQKRHWLRLTRVCNNNCVFCLDSDAQDGSFLSFEEIRQDLKKGRAAGCRRVVLSGGEPTVHPGFTEIVESAKQAGYTHIQVVTNGRLFAYPDFLRKCMQAGISEITFSMHGHTAKLHDRQTRVPGSFKQSLAGLMNALRTKKLIISVDIVINKINVKYLEDILKFFINLGVHEFDLLQVMPFGRAWENKEKVLYDAGKTLPYLKRVFNLSKKPYLYIWTNRFPPKFLEGFEELIQHPYKLFDEVRGRRKMFEELISNGKKMFCYGKRCKFCFLEDFCYDLITLKKRRILQAKKRPECIDNGGSHKGLRKKLSLSDIIDGKQIRLDIFTEFYIDNRYFLKAGKCEKCRFSSRCSGAPVGYIREKGFGALRPSKKNSNKIRRKR